MSKYFDLHLLETGLVEENWHGWREIYLFATVGADYRSWFRYRVTLLIAPFAVGGRLESSLVAGIVPVNKQESQAIPRSVLRCQPRIQSQSYWSSGIMVIERRSTN